MKFIVCVIAAFAALQFVGAYDLGNFNVSLWMESMGSSVRPAEVSTLKSKLIQFCPGKTYKIDNVIKEIMECAEGIDDTEETLCSVLKNHVKPCLKPLTNFMEECLPTQSNEIPTMVLDMVISAAAQLCRTDGEHILELGNACVKTANAKSQRCIRTIVSKFQQYKRQEIAPTAANVCDLLQTLRPCIQSHLNSACGHPITRESYLELYDESMKICKKYQKNEIDT